MAFLAWPLSRRSCSLGSCLNQSKILLLATANSLDAAYWLCERANNATSNLNDGGYARFGTVEDDDDDDDDDMASISSTKPYSSEVGDRRCRDSRLVSICVNCLRDFT